MTEPDAPSFVSPAEDAASRGRPGLRGGAGSGARWGWWALLLVLLVAGLWAWHYWQLGQWLTLDRLQASRDALQARVHAAPLPSAALFFALYVAVTALSIPGAVVMTLAAGAVFGFGWGLLLVSFASSLGALLAFWVARHLARAPVQARFGRALAPIDEGVRRDGVFYLLTLRLVPLFPFWMINLLMGLTPIPARTFYAVSQVGMLPGTAVFVNAGTQLAAVRSVDDILSPGLIASFVVLAAFPWLARAGVGWLQRRQRFAPWAAERPRRFDRNLVVIGAGAGGLVTAYIAAAVKAQVTLVEQHQMGGDCLNTGCVPSKALLRAAKAAQERRTAGRFGVHGSPPEVDFAGVMAHVQAAIRRIEPHDSVARYTGLGVEVLQGRARLRSPWHVEVEQADGSRQTLTTRAIVLATGAQPTLPELPGLDGAPYVTSDTLWTLKALPQRLLVMGGGPIGCEMAQAFARLGSTVTLIDRGPRLLGREEPEASALLAEVLVREGMRLRLAHTAVQVLGPAEGWRLRAEAAEGPVDLPFDVLLVAVGRSPRVAGFGLEELGIALTGRGTVQTDPWLTTNLPNVYAVGDVAGPYQLTHAASHQAWTGAVNALFGRFKRFKAEYRVLPWCTYTDPEVARVGLSVAEAQAQGIAHEVTEVRLDGLDRAIAEGATDGFVRVLTEPGRDRILGATVVGAHAGELIAQWALAMKHGIGLNKVLGTVFPYPTWSEANKQVAGAWKRAHAPQRLLAWVARYHRWERG